METKDTYKRSLWKDLAEKDTELKLGLLSNHFEATRLLINELFEEELIEKAGRRYSRKQDGHTHRRWSSNPGCVQVGDRKLRVEVPRLQDTSTGKCAPVERYEGLKRLSEPSQELHTK
jgi:transposase-like protein